jgi:hypothetical protein
VSNSVVFLVIAVGLSVLGSFVVWLHGRPRRTRSSVDHFNRGLQALSSNGGRYEAQSGVVLRREGDPPEEPVEAAPVEPEPTARAPRPSPRPSPRPRPQTSEREGTRPGP